MAQATFYINGTRYERLKISALGQGNVAIYQLFIPSMKGTVYETVKISPTGEYPSDLPAVADNRRYRTHRHYKATRRYNFWLGHPITSPNNSSGSWGKIFPATGAN
jgi:hypothetical protein